MAILGRIHETAARRAAEAPRERPENPPSTDPARPAERGIGTSASDGEARLFAASGSLRESPAAPPAPGLFGLAAGLDSLLPVSGRPVAVAPRDTAPGADLMEQAAQTRRDMQAELAERRQHLEELRDQEPDGGIEEWFKDVLPGVDAESERLAGEIAEEEREIARLEALLADPERRFLKVDVNGDGRIVEILGDLRGADHVAIHVPGMDTDIDDYTAATQGDARALYTEMRRQAPGENVAVVAFLDYNPPDNDLGGWFGGAGEAVATDGARALDAWVDRLHEDGFTADQLSVVAHSYGSTTTGIALEHEDLAVGRVAVVGSPGLGDGVDDVSDLGRPEVTVYAGKAEGTPLPGGDGDPITWLPAHGEDPADDGFGAIRFSTGDASGHSEYFHGESLRNLALIAIGRDPTLR